MTESLNDEVVWNSIDQANSKPKRKSIESLDAERVVSQEESDEPIPKKRKFIPLDVEAKPDEPVVKKRKFVPLDAATLLGQEEPLVNAERKSIVEARVKPDERIVRKRKSIVPLDAATLLGQDELIPLAKRKSINPVDDNDQTKQETSKFVTTDCTTVAIVDTGTMICQTELCECNTSRASFNLPGCKEGRWCKLCKVPGAISVRGRFCVECGKRANFNLPGSDFPMWCASCKDPLAVDVVKHHCKCGRSKPCFDLPGSKTGQWCSICKPPNAVDIRNKRCESCHIKNPSFNVPGTSKARWCKDCMPSNAVNIRKRRCDCGKTPRMALPGDSIPIWCARCVLKPPEAIDVVTKRCRCGRAKPTFGLKDSFVAIWCIKCTDRPADAVDVKNRTCSCGNRACFGIPGAPLEFCADCPDMPPEAVRYGQKCNCGHYPHFGIVGQKMTHCGTCRLPGMVEYPRRKCAQCKQFALYGPNQTHRLRCEDHKLETDFNLVEKNCRQCNLLQILNQDGLCQFCEPNAVKRYTKRAEDRVDRLLKAHNLRYVSHDKPVEMKCGKDRPDFLFECVTTVDPLLNTSSTDIPTVSMHYVVLEVDEDQHKSYACDCEQTRMINITQSCGGLRTFWIRYNPDSFTLPNGTKSTITDHTREQHLIEWIKYAMKRPPKALAEVVHLFYDGYNEKSGEADIKALPDPLGVLHTAQSTSSSVCSSV